MIVMDAIIYVGKAIGTQIGVAIKLTYGWIPLFSCGLSLNLINMAYIILVVREDKIIISEDNPSVDKGGAKQILTGSILTDSNIKIVQQIDIVLLFQARSKRFSIFLQPPSKVYSKQENLAAEPGSLP